MNVEVVTMRAAIGRSLHVGLNRIDVDHYGVDGALAGCEFDAKDMEAIAAARGFQTQILLTDRATVANVTSAIAEAAAALRPGDLLLITYSGHGAQVPDLNGDEGQDEKDETWVLYDRMLVDDELYALWGQFAEAVRIAVVSDSCHSGSVTRDVFFDPEPSGRYRMLPRESESRTYTTHRDLYDGIQATNPQGDHVGVGASVLLLSGCLDNQRSLDGDRNGAYTEALLRVLLDEQFQGGYRGFQEAIGRLMPPSQTPAFFPVGLTSPLFEAQPPFTI
jgi:hypothetical protein